VETPLKVVGLTLRTESDRPESRPPSVDVFVSYEPLDGARAARLVGWRDFDQG
jgi:hypothetical protein